MEARESIARFCLFQSQHPCAKRHRLLDLPWPVDQMPITWKAHSLYMRWCLDCHEAPEKSPAQRSDFQHGMAAACRINSNAGSELIAEYHISTNRLHNCAIAACAIDEDVKTLNRLTQISEIRSRRDSREARLACAASDTGAAWMKLPRRRNSRKCFIANFPTGASEWDDGVSRRSFLKMAAASLALAGLTPARNSHRRNSALCQTAGGIGSGRTAFLRDGHVTRRLRHRRAGEKPRRTSDQSGR